METPPQRPGLHFLVGPREAGMRADVFLAGRLPDHSRSQIRAEIRGGGILSDLRRLKPSSGLKEGESLTVTLPELDGPVEPKPAVPRVLWADAHFVAFDKPTGLLAHPAGGIYIWGLINLAREAFPDEDLHLLHRLDRETSGVNLVSRTKLATVNIKEAFKQRAVLKTYHAIVRGVVPWEQRLVDAPIGSDPDSPVRLKQAVVADGQSAVTEVRVIQRFRDLTLVSCRPHTGRTHQIRVHLDHLGFPILGDRLYGQDPEVFLNLLEGRPTRRLRRRLGHPRHCLHARALHLPHPATGEVISVRAPMPADMARVLRKAR